MVSIQFGAVLAKGLFPAVGAQGTTTIRLVVGAVILAIILRPWRGPLPRRIAPALIGYGATLAAMNLSFYLSIRTVPLGIAVAIEFAGPLLVATLTSRRRTDFAWILLALAGLLLLSPIFYAPIFHTDAGAPLDARGVAFALSAAAFWALYIVFGRIVGQTLGPRGTALGMSIAAILILPVGILHAGRSLLDPVIVPRAMGVGVFSSALPYSLEMVALIGLPARVYGTLTSVEPALGALLGIVLLHETLSGLQWAGIGIVIVAAIGATATIRQPSASLPE